MASFSSPALAVPVSAHDHIRGPADAAVTVLEYGDYECPYCVSAHAVVEELRRRLDQSVCFAFRHFPMTDLHRHAYSAAEMAEAAGVQQRFWEMHDLLFANHGALDEQHLVGYAATLGLELPQVRLALTSHCYGTRVREDFMSGVKSGVSKTPTLFVDGERYRGPIDVGALSSAVIAAGAARGNRRAQAPADGIDTRVRPSAQRSAP